MSVTVLNNTNSFINVCLSAGINYHWYNHLPPKTYVSLGNPGEIVTLNVRWWLGETTEYENSVTQIGLFVAGTVIGLAGLALAIPTGGASLTLTTAAAAGLGLWAGGASVAIGGLSVGAVDFFKTKVAQPGLIVSNDPIFMVEGALGLSTIDNGIVNVSKETIPLKLAKPKDPLQTYIDLGWVVGRKNPNEMRPIGATYVQELDRSLTGDVIIYPSYCGVPAEQPGRWELSADKITDANRPVQLQVREDEKTEWVIEPDMEVDANTGKPTNVLKKYKVYNPKTTPADKNFDSAAFYLKNRGLGAYACVSKLDNSDDKMVHMKKEKDKYCLFFLIKSGDCHAFVPISRETRDASTLHLTALTHEGGHTGNNTHLVVGDRNSANPGWARFVVDAVRPKLDDAAKLSAQQLTDLKVFNKRVRIYPAVVRNPGKKPGDDPLCWEIENDKAAQGKIQCWPRHNGKKKCEWMIQKATGIAADNVFTLYNPEFKAWATVGVAGAERKDHLLYSTTSGDLGAASWFYIEQTMGYLRFWPLDTPGEFLTLESKDSGAKIRHLPSVNPPNNSSKHQAPRLAWSRWAVIPTDSQLAIDEHWPSDN